MEGKKNYLQPRGAVLDAIHDIVELLRGRQTICDTPNGKISTHLTMYGYRWDVKYFVKDIGKNRCSVTIEINGDLTDKRREIRSNK